MSTDANLTAAALASAAEAPTASTQPVPTTAPAAPAAVSLNSPNWQILQMMSRANYAASTQVTALATIASAADDCGVDISPALVRRICDDLADSIAAQRSGVNLLNAKRRATTPGVPVRRIS